MIDNGPEVPYDSLSAILPMFCIYRRMATHRRCGDCQNGARTVIKLDIINEVVNKTGVTKTKAELAVETVFESMKKALSRGDRIELRGFGVFNVRPRKTGIGRNPRTGAEVNIPPGKAVRFKPGKELQSID
jgi:DNA-binding protein HU-beta